MDTPAETFEMWARVDGYEGLYEVSDLGRIRRIGKAAQNGNGRGGGVRLGRILSTRVGRSGYPEAQLWRDGKTQRVTVHRLVARAFLGACPPNHEVNHIDGKKDNPKASNLEYVTRAENVNHAYRTGLRQPTPPTKLTPEQVRQIRSEASQSSQRKLAQRFGVARRTIRSVIGGLSWKKI